MEIAYPVVSHRDMLGDNIKTHNKTTEHFNRNNYFWTDHALSYYCDLKLSQVD